MSRLNVHFKQCEGTYIQTLDNMLESGSVSARGLKPDAKVFGELVFDVNTAYFEEHGGYEYAKQFFREAFHFAEKEIGADYILSAVMHADERNRTLSEETGHDVYHYHMHVIYIPVVAKEIKWSKRCKDKSLVGTTREVIHQISHSKKWAFVPALDEQEQPIFTKDGKPRLIPSYSLLQDRLFTHMREAGFEDFERGVKGSTAEHLSVLDFKIHQDMEKVSALDEKIQEQQSNLTALNGELDSAQQIYTSVREIDEVGKKKMFGKVELAEKEYGNLASLAKEGIALRRSTEKLSEQLSAVQGELLYLKSRFDEVLDETREFREAMRLAPQKVKQLFSDIFRQAKETQELKRMQSQRSGRKVR
jgi:hypothetical protein